MAVREKPIAPNVLDVLRRGEIGPDFYRLPEKLDPDTYKFCNKVLLDNGARWDKKRNAHVFGPLGMPERLAAQLEAGRSSSVQQETQFFETPAPVVSRVIVLADLRKGLTVLEPSAGLGALAFPAASAVGSKDLVKFCETHFPFYHKLIAGGFKAVGSDFLKLDTDVERICFDRVVMNPPFTRGQDVRHVSHAFRFLRLGGRLVAVMSNGWRNNSDAASLAFRDLVDRYGVAVEDVEAGAFARSGTEVATCIVVLEAPSA